MRSRWTRFGVLVAAGRTLLQSAGYAAGLNEDVSVFLRDFAREALAAFLF